MDKILEDIKTIFREVLDNENLSIKPETTSDDIEEWDSLAHIQLVVAIEKHFKLKFKTEEIMAWENVGAMCEAIHLYLN